MSDETKFVRDGKTRIAGSPKERVRLKADGWVEVDAFPPPPLAGTGSTNAAWQGWAAAEGVNVPDGATRTEIIEAAGLTEPDASPDE